MGFVTKRINFKRNSLAYVGYIYAYIHIYAMLMRMIRNCSNCKVCESMIIRSTCVIYKLQSIRHEEKLPFLFGVVNLCQGLPRRPLTCTEEETENSVQYYIRITLLAPCSLDWVSPSAECCSISVSTQPTVAGCGRMNNSRNFITSRTNWCANGLYTVGEARGTHCTTRFNRHKRRISSL